MLDTQHIAQLPDYRSPVFPPLSTCWWLSSERPRIWYLMSAIPSAQRTMWHHVNFAECLLSNLFINSFTENIWLLHVILPGIAVISKDMSHLRTTKVVSKAALTLFSRPVSTHFKELPTDFFTRVDLFLNQPSRQRHWDHTWLAQRRNFVITVENIEIVLVLTLVTMLVT